MKFEMNTIDHLGINMYANLPPVISELVANSWDADSPDVKIMIPDTQIDENYQITISDSGAGMSFDELNAAFLKIGRDRRKDLGSDVTPKGRKVIGRKGLGKLSVFGVAKLVNIESVKDGNKIIFEMNLDDIRTSNNGIYKPKIIVNEKTSEVNGVKITLGNLKRKNKIFLPAIRRGLAQRFSVLGQDFVVLVNDDPLKPEERNLKENTEYSWEIDEEIMPGSNWKIHGWIGTLPGTVRGDMARGIVIMARGKLVQEPTLFDVRGGKELAYSYMVGELHADFLDEQEDLIATYRSSIVWESEAGQALKGWGQNKIKKLSQEWSNKRVQERESGIRETPEIDTWLKSLSGSERRIADKMIRTITMDDNMSKDKAIELVNYVKESFELQAFRDLAAQISDTPSEKDAQLLTLFREWQFLESREILRLFEGRLATIRKFQQYIETNAREVPTIHKFFKDFPWVLDPRWTDFEDEVTFSKLLREKYSDSQKLERDRRIDFICIGFGDTVHVVELKRPGYKIKKEDLEQIQDYVAFIKTRLGNDPSGYKDAAGYLICGEIDEAPEIREKITINENSRIYTRRYTDLLAATERLHRVFMKKYEDLHLKSQNENLTESDFV